jgi:hypothetical protein
VSGHGFLPSVLSALAALPFWFQIVAGVCAFAVIAGAAVMAIGGSGVRDYEE